MTDTDERRAQAEVIWKDCIWTASAWTLVNLSIHMSVHSEIYNPQLHLYSSNYHNLPSNHHSDDMLSSGYITRNPLPSSIDSATFNVDVFSMIMSCVGCSLGVSLLPWLSQHQHLFLSSASEISSVSLPSSITVPSTAIFIALSPGLCPSQSSL
ncbi:unnamed protein product [Rangifer tarandus platyrhynchus]|uniref:Uncharacterized protein n=2 Tax=Rangifer tarandus platyrhynchus TaxID=3082113 RepID=A0ABN8ZWS9_RANTA|nr:unnamed protein product [Rangifer tarandus platyrhynchus]